MATEPARDISEILSDPAVVVQAAIEAAQDAIRRHKQMGFPMAVWRDGKVAWVAPEELERKEEEKQISDKINREGEASAEPFRPFGLRRR